MAENNTPVISCPDPSCGHPINQHAANRSCAATAFSGCACKLDPNSIALHLLFGDLTPSPTTPPRTVVRNRS